MMDMSDNNRGSGSEMLIMIVIKGGDVEEGE